MHTSFIRCSRRWVRFCPGSDDKVFPIEVLEADPVNHLSNIWEDVFEYTHYACAICLTEA